jgi:hypothetical protein
VAYLSICLIIIFSISLGVYQCHLFVLLPAYGFSPTFGKQEIQDPLLDSVNVKTKQHTSSSASFSTDILAVDYYSNGKILNAILWLQSAFDQQPTKYKYKAVDYGILIDSDFDKTTGYGGIDYQFEIGWNNQTKLWNERTVEWSPNGEQRTINSKSNYTGFFEDKKRYVFLSLDLGSLLYPTKYKATFYADAVDENNTFVTDFTRWVAIPPLQLTIITSPSNLILTPGEQKTVEIKLNSTKGYEPLVNLSATTPSNNIHINFKKGFGTVRIPTYGIATTSATISAADNASIAPYTLTFFANSSFPAEQLISARPHEEHSTLPFRGATEASQNVFSQSTMSLAVQEPTPPLENFVKAWITPVTGIWTLLAGVVAVMTPILIRLYSKRSKKNDYNKTDDNN